MPRDWLVLPKLPRALKPVLHPRGPGKRSKLIQITPAVPYLGPFASQPERMLARELIRRGYEVRGQVPFAGGSTTAGGLIADLFLPNMGDKGTVIRVQGEYWHTRPGSAAKDDAQSYYLNAQGVKVIDVWANDIIKRMDWVIQYQIGIPL